MRRSQTCAAVPHGRNVLLLFIVLLPLFFGRLDDLPLPKWDDLTHAAMGKEILVTGDWFTMHANGEPIWIKPPLYFWLEAVVFSLFGPSEYGARLPSALCGYLCAILIYLLTRRLFGRKTAFLAILVTATSFLFLKYSRRAMIDVPAAFAVTLGMYALVRAEERDRDFLLYGLAIALGYYFKAIQGLYLALIGPCYLLLTGQARRLVNPWFLAAHAVAAALVALWAVPQALVNGNAFLSSQSAFGPLFSRGLTDAPAPLFEPLLVLARIFWPWIPLSVLGCVLLARRRPADRATALLGCWLFVVLATLCTSRSFFQRYLLPAVPALIIAAAFALAAILNRRLFSLLYRRAVPVAGALVILVQILPVPLDNRGTDQIGLFRAARQITTATDPIVLYKDNHWTVGQGLSFYADRRLAHHFDDAGEFSRFLGAADSAVYGIASAAEYHELGTALGDRVAVRARADSYVLFEAPARRR